jgi:NTE family protein
MRLRWRMAYAQCIGKSQSDPREAARESLANFWNGIVNMGAIGQAQRAPFEMLLGLAGGHHSVTSQWASAMTRAFSGSMSPYQMNPLDLNPLKTFVERQVDFERLTRLKDIKVFVVATRVTTGKAEVFSGKRLTADAVMASACLPMMFQAVEIEGDHYWDGGYSGNPAIHPLIYKCEAATSCWCRSTRSSATFCPPMPLTSWTGSMKSRSIPH